MAATQVVCPECRQSYRVAEASPTGKVRCTRCGEVFDATSAATGEQSPAPPSRSRGNGDKSPGGGPAASRPKPAARLGRFEIRRRLGAGGFGTVYLAYDPLLDRDVALKVPHQSAASNEQHRRRYLREAKAAAELRHPHLVPIFDAGTEGGRFYLASAYVEGRTLDQTSRDSPPDFRQAARWIHGLAEALDYAHSQGVVHRDVKPSNVLIDSQSQPLLADFGLARLDTDQATLTQDGTVLGTPAYMSPEQARGDSAAVGPASDQYSLGAALYELLCGEPPFVGVPAAVIARVIHEDPMPARKRNPKVPRDLDTICQRAMAKDASRRYASCQEMADDLRRWLEDEPIHARRMGWGERARRWTRRNPAVAALAALLLMALVGGIVVSGGFATLATRRAQEAEANATTARRETARAEENAVLAKREVERADREAKRAQDAVGRLEGALRGEQQQRQRADQEAKRALEAVEKLEVAIESERNVSRELDAELYCSRMAQAEFNLYSGELTRAQNLIAAAGRFDDRWEWRFLDDHINPSCVRFRLQVPSRQSGSNGILADPVAWSPDGNRLAISGRLGRGVHIFEIPSAAAGDSRQGAILAGRSFGVDELAGFAETVAWSPDGTKLAAASKTKFAVFDVDSGETLADTAEFAKFAAWSPSGDSLLTTTADAAELVALRASDDFQTVMQRWPVSDFGASKSSRLDHASWRNDGREIAVAIDETPGLLICTSRLDGARGWSHRAFPDTWSNGRARASWSPDGRYVAAMTSFYRGVVVMDAESGERVADIPSGDSVDAMTWSADGSRLVVAGRDRLVMIWDIEREIPVGRWVPTGSALEAIAWSPRADRLVTLSSRDELVFAPDNLTSVRSAFRVDERLSEAFALLTWDQDGSRLVVTNPHWAAWNVEEQRLDKSLDSQAIRSFMQGYSNRVISPSGTYGIGIKYDSSPRRYSGFLVDLTGQGRQHELVRLENPKATRDEVMAWSAAGTRVFVSVGSQPRKSVVFDAETNAPIELSDAGIEEAYLSAAAFSPDGKQLVLTYDDYHFVVHDLKTKQCRVEKTPSVCIGVSWDPPGGSFAIALRDAIQVWDAASGTLQITINRDTGRHPRMALHPHGRLLAVLQGATGVPELYELESGRQVIAFHALNGVDVAWSPDGNTLAVACDDGNVELLTAPAHPASK